MTWTHRHPRPKRNPERERIAVGGLLPLAMLAGGFALDEDDDVPASDVVNPAA